MTTVTTKERKREEWPHLVVKGVDSADMNKLEKLARPKRGKGTSKIGGEFLDRGKITDTPFTGVSTMTPEFVAALAALDAPAAEAMGKAWAAQLDGVTEDHAVDQVKQMARERPDLLSVDLRRVEVRAHRLARGPLRARVGDRPAARHLAALAGCGRAAQRIAFALRVWERGVVLVQSSTASREVVRWPPRSSRFLSLRARRRRLSGS